MIRKLFYIFMAIGFVACFDNNINRGKVSSEKRPVVQRLKVSHSALPAKEAIFAFNRFISDLSANTEIQSGSELYERAKLYLPDSSIFEQHFLFGQEIAYRDSFRLLFYEFTPEASAPSHLYFGCFHPTGTLIDLLKAKQLSNDGNISINLIDDEIIEVEYADFYLSDDFYTSDVYLYKVPDSLKNLEHSGDHTLLRNYAKRKDFEQITFYENYRIQADGSFERISGERDVIRQRKYPAASTRILSYQELDRLKHHQLAMIRNEIFAAHGYIFSDKKKRRYFRRKKWYQPLFENVDDLLTDVEQINIAKIEEREITY